MTIEYIGTPANVSALYDYCWKHAAYFRRRMIFNAVLFGLSSIAISFSIQRTIHKDDVAIALALALALPFLAPFIAELRPKGINERSLLTQLDFTRRSEQERETFHGQGLLICLPPKSTSSS